MTKDNQINRLNSIQALRFFAAFLVVITHISYQINERLFGKYGIANDFWVSGQSGVDVFFVISGFVMVYTTNVGKPHDWIKFAIRRLIRIVPLYWLATVLKILLVFVFANQVMHSENNLSHIVASFAFLPHLNLSGKYLPVVPAGWTLNYEMFYYFIFTVALFLKFRPLAFCSITFILLVLCGKLFDIGGSAGYYCDAIIFEFIIGMLIAKFFKHLQTRFDFYIGLTSILCGIGIIFFVPPSDWMLDNRWIFWGGAGAALVFGVVTIEKVGVNNYPNWVISLGDSSYSIYLFHAMVIPAVIIVCIKLNISSYASIFILTGSVSLITGYLIHILIEKPVTQFLKERVATFKLQ